MAWLVIGFLWYFTPWESVAKQILIAESIMQGFGTYYIFRTVTATDTWEGPPSARMMYAGAMVTLIFTLLALVGLVVALYAMIQQDETSKDMQQKEKSKGMRRVVLGLGLGLLAFAGRWIFHVGYLRLAQDL